MKNSWRLIDFDAEKMTLHFGGEPAARRVMLKLIPPSGHSDQARELSEKELMGFLGLNNSEHNVDAMEDDDQDDENAGEDEDDAAGIEQDAMRMGDMDGVDTLVPDDGDEVDGGKPDLDKELSDIMMQEMPELLQIWDLEVTGEDTAVVASARPKFPSEKASRTCTYCCLCFLGRPKIVTPNTKEHDMESKTRSPNIGMNAPCVSICAIY